MKKRTSKEIFGDTLLLLARGEAMERITVKQIVEQSGLSLQTFYNHFRDKDDLIAWLHREGCQRALNRLEERHSSFHEIVLASIRFFAENDNFLRSSFGAGVTNPYSRLSLESACNFLGVYICRRNALDALPEQLRLYLQIYVFACLCAFSEWAVQRWEGMTEEDLAVCLEQSVPMPLRPYLTD